MTGRLIGVVLAVAIAAGCGVPNDDAPRAVAAEEIPEALVAAPTTTSIPVDGVDTNLYFVATTEGESELRIQRSKVDNLTVSTVLNALVNAVPEEELTTAIPPEVAILDTAVEGDIVTIDLSAEFSDVSGATRELAVGQLVLTATDLPRIEGVRFSVEGEEIPVPDADGVDVDGPVDPADYAGLLPEPG